MTHTVFVYGSLMKGFGNHRLLEGSEYVGPGAMSGLDLYSLGGFPGAVDGTGTIEGEIYEVNQATLARLDRLEGHPTFYERQEQEAFNKNMNGMTIVSFYNYQGDVSTRDYIPSGSWREHNATPVHDD